MLKVSAGSLVSRRGFGLAAAVMSVALMTACASGFVETFPPNLPAKSVVIVTGVGMVPSAQNDPRYESMWLGAAKSYAEALRADIAKTGKKAQLDIKSDRSVKGTDYIAKLLATEKRDALVQVVVTHVRNSTENTVYLEASFLPLVYTRDVNGRLAATAQEGPIKRYPLFSMTGKDMRDASLSGLAVDFNKELRGKGLLQ